MRNARELRIDGEEPVEGHHEKVECHRLEEAWEDGKQPGVPEEYDRDEGLRRTDVAIPGGEAEEAELQAFGHILKFPTTPRPVNYCRTLASSATGIPTWFVTSRI